MNNIKKSYNISMTYDVSDAEKAHAEKALLAFNYSLKELNIAKEYLNVMYIPFKDNPNISEREIVNFRAALRRYRDKSIENFNKFKFASFKCVSLMEYFSYDTQSNKLIKSFIASVEALEDKVNKFSELFAKLEDKNLVNDLIKSIENIQKEIDKIIEIIDDRIKTHIHTNILGKTWVDDVGNKLNLKIEKKVPLLQELNKQRDEQLNNLKNKQ